MDNILRNIITIAVVIGMGYLFIMFINVAIIILIVGAIIYFIYKFIKKLTCKYGNSDDESYIQDNTYYEDSNNDDFDDEKDIIDVEYEDVEEDDNDDEFQD